MTHRVPFRVEPMLATLATEPFDKPGWVYEEKYDGDRILAYKEGARVLLLSRSGKDNTSRFPTIVAAIQRLRDVTYLQPCLVAQISYQELTHDRKLRQAVYLGLRDDKRVSDVTLPEPSA